MTTLARPSQGVVLSVHTSDASTVNISGITAANPAVVTTSAAHGRADGDVVSIASVAGMTQINGTQAMVNVLTSTTFELVGINSTGFSAYTSGGTVTPYVFTNLCEITSFAGNDPGAQLIEVSNICSVAKEYLAGLPDDGTATLGFNFVPSDAGLQRLWAMRDAGSVDWFRVKVPATTLDPAVWFTAGKALVQSLLRWPNFGVNQAITGNGSLKFTGGTYHLIA